MSVTTAAVNTLFRCHAITFQKRSKRPSKAASPICVAWSSSL